MAQSIVATRDGQGIARGAVGKFTGDGTAVTVTLGFKPKQVKLVDITGVIVWEKFDGMTDAQCLKTVTAGTLTVDGTSAIILTSSGFVVLAAVDVSAHAFVFYAE